MVFSLVILVCSWEDVTRFLPRLGRELLRNSVNWEAQVVAARSLPKFQLSRGSLQISVISLKRTPSRRECLIKQLQHDGIELEIFDAVDGLFEFQRADILKYAGPRKRIKILH